MISYNSELVKEIIKNKACPSSIKDLVQGCKGEGEKQLFLLVWQFGGNALLNMASV